MSQKPINPKPSASPAGPHRAQRTGQPRPIGVKTKGVEIKKAVSQGILLLVVGVSAGALIPRGGMALLEFSEQQSSQAQAKSARSSAAAIASAPPATPPKTPPAPALEYTVISLGDGDTLKVFGPEGKLTVRLACIDAPELAQAPYGRAARARLRELAAVETKVSLNVVDQDRYGRTVAEVFTSQTNVNLQLVKEGHAVAYRQYLSKCDANAYLAAETEAKSKALAFWNQSNPTLPWDYRQAAKQPSTSSKPNSPTPNPTPNPTPAAVSPPSIPKPVAVPAPIAQAAPTQAPPAQAAPTQSCDPNYTGACIPLASLGDVDCGEIRDRRFSSIGSDPHRLDGDKDGIACES